MSDELLEYSARKSSANLMDDSASEAPAKTGGLNRLSTIFLVVLGLHVVVIVGISAYHLLRGNPDTGITSMDPMPAAEVAKAPVAKTIDPLAFIPRTTPLGEYGLDAPTAAQTVLVKLATRVRLALAVNV